MFFLMLPWCAIAAPAQNRGIAEGRLVNLTDPKIIVAGAELEVLELNKGMGIIKTASTDATGAFRIEDLTNSSRLMLRAIYKGANYHGALNFDADGKAYLELGVYEPTASMKDIRFDSARMAFQRDEDHIHAVETYTIVNKTTPPKAYVNPEGTFRVSKAPGILEPPRIRVTAPGAEMPLTQAALESADGKSYYSLYPIRPGVTVFEVRQTLPYTDDKYVYAKKFFQDCASLEIGVIPGDMTLTGEGLAKTETNAERNFSVYSGGPVRANTEAEWVFAGGTPIADEEGSEITITAGDGIVSRHARVIGPLMLLCFASALWYAYNKAPEESTGRKSGKAS